MVMFQGPTRSEAVPGVGRVLGLPGPAAQAAQTSASAAITASLYLGYFPLLSIRTRL